MAAGVLAGVAAGVVAAAAPVLTNAAATQPLLTSSGLLTRYHAPSSLTATISTVTPWGSLPITAAVLLGRTRTLRRGAANTWPRVGASLCARTGSGVSRTLRARIATTQSTQPLLPRTR
jgi:hypothetical protein